MKLLGVKQGEMTPVLYSSDQTGSEKALLSVAYMQNPIGKPNSQRVVVKGRSAQIIYDAQTIIKLNDLFKIQETSTLHK